MKTILIIIPTLRGGGAEKLLVDILNNIDTRTYSVQLMLFYDDNVYSGSIPQKINTIVPFYIRTGIIQTLKRACLKMCGLEDTLRGKKIRDAADAHYDTIVSFLEGMALHFHTFLLDRADKNITFVHTDLSRYPISLNKRSASEYGSMDTIAFVSCQACDSFEKVFPSNRSRHVVLPNFIDTDAVLAKSRVFNVDKSVPTFVCVGRLEKVKGVDILIETAMILRNRMHDFLFRIVGSGLEEARLKEAVRAHQLDPFFVFEGFQRNPYPFIATADILLSTSLAEGFSLVICEAMALGIPVISSKTDGAQSLLGGGAGILVDRTPEGYADAIVALMNDEAMYQQYVLKGKEKAKEHDKSVYLPRLYEIL